MEEDIFYARIFEDKLKEDKKFVKSFGPSESVADVMIASANFVDFVERETEMHMDVRIEETEIRDKY